MYMYGLIMYEIYYNGEKAHPNKCNSNFIGENIVPIVCNSTKLTLAGGFKLYKVFSSNTKHSKGKI